MKLLKYIFLLLIIVLIGGCVFFATKEGTYDITDSKIVNAPVEVVFKIVNDYRTWETWGSWKKEDPTMTFSYPKNTVGEGASYSWDGAMSGSMKTTLVKPFKEIKQDLTLQTPAGERNPEVYWTFEEVENGTKVTWGIKGTHALIDKAFYMLSGTDFETEMRTMHTKGFEGLASMSQQVMDVYTIEVNGMIHYSGGYYLYTTAATSTTKIDQTKKRLLNQITTYASQNNIAIAGAPFSLYNEIDSIGGSAIISACIPVREQMVPENNDVLSGFMPAVATIKTTLKGKHSYLPEAYRKGETYLMINGYTPHPTANMFEIYNTDPKQDPNPANWITEIYMPIIIPTTQ